MGKALLFFVIALLLLAGGSAWIALYPAVPADLGGVENLDHSARRVRIPVGEGDHLDGWYLHERRDARAALDWVREQPELRGGRVSLYGESLGGAVALALAAERPDVNAVV